jgi:hypothetical protein
MTLVRHCECYAGFGKPSVGSGVTDRFPKSLHRFW